MWKKDESSKSSPFGEEKLESGNTARFSGGPPAVIGPSLIIDGNIRGDEDLLVEGEVKGDISLPANVVTIGTNGKVKARINAAVIVVEGSLEGDLVGEEQIEIRRSGNVIGNIVAPRVGLEDGAQFKGNIDMSPKHKSTPVQATTAAPTPAPKEDKEKHGGPLGKDSDPKLPG